MSILFEDGLGCDLLVMNMIGGFSLQAILVFGYVFGICVIICGSADLPTTLRVVIPNVIHWSTIFSLVGHRFLVNRHYYAIF